MGGWTDGRTDGPMDEVAHKTVKIEALSHFRVFMSPDEG